MHHSSEEACVFVSITDCCGLLQQLVASVAQVLQLIVSYVGSHSCTHSIPIACTMMCINVRGDMTTAIQSYCFSRMDWTHFRKEPC